MCEEILFLDEIRLGLILNIQLEYLEQFFSPFTLLGLPALGGGGMNFGISTNGTISGTSIFVQAQANIMPAAVGAFASVGASVLS